MPSAVFSEIYIEIDQNFTDIGGDRLVYKHPLIQYKVFNGFSLLVGLKEGAYLLKAIPRLEFLEIYYQKYSILKQETRADNVDFGLTENIVSYSFNTPWIGLNEENYNEYVGLRKNHVEAKTLLNRILIGNLLSMSKTLGYVVEDRIRVITHLEESSFFEVKDGVKLAAFKGGFETNFLIPDLWGIGKFSSRGYGIVRSNSGGHTR